MERISKRGANVVLSGYRHGFRKRVCNRVQREMCRADTRAFAPNSYNIVVLDNIVNERRVM